MRKTMLTLLGLCLLLSSPSLAADSQSAGSKAGFVEIDRIMMESAPAQDTRKMMEEKYRKDAEALKKSEESLQAKVKALKKNPKASDEKKSAYIKEYQSFQQKRAALAQKQQEDMVKFQQEMVELVFAAAGNVGKAKGVDFILDSRTIFYATKALNMTDEVLAEVNKLYKEKPKKEEKSANDKGKDDKDGKDKDDKAKSDKSGKDSKKEKK